MPMARASMTSLGMRRNCNPIREDHMNIDKNCCETCHFLEGNPAFGLRCHRYPQEVEKRLDDWCDEWQPKNQSERIQCQD